MCRDRPISTSIRSRWWSCAGAHFPNSTRCLPIDAIVPTAHGAAMACLDEKGGLALPVMDYTSEPPPEIVAEYRKIMPSFAEAFCPLLPLAITHGLQLYWQMRMWPEDFARGEDAAAVDPVCGLPAVGRAGHRDLLHGVPDASARHPREATPSRMARELGWDRLFPRDGQGVGGDRRGSSPSSAARHSEARGGCWAACTTRPPISCAMCAPGSTASRWSRREPGASASIRRPPSSVLDPERDTNTNTDVLGRNVCCSRFFGGKEFEAVAGGARRRRAILAGRGRAGGARHLCPSLLHLTSGPVPGSLGKGYVKGPAAAGDAREQASLAALYCALMVSEQLDAIASKDDIIVDGPFSQNKVLLAVLAALRPRQTVKASALRDGTTAGAAAMALIEEGQASDDRAGADRCERRRRSRGSMPIKRSGGGWPMRNADPEFSSRRRKLESRLPAAAGCRLCWHDGTCLMYPPPPSTAPRRERRWRRRSARIRRRSGSMTSWVRPTARSGPRSRRARAEDAGEVAEALDRAARVLQRGRRTSRPARRSARRSGWRCWRASR